VVGKPSLPGATDDQHLFSLRPRGGREKLRVHGRRRGPGLRGLLRKRAPQHPQTPVRQNFAQEPTGINELIPKTDVPAECLRSRKRNALAFKN
jgi:hypothetical protein